MGDKRNAGRFAVFLVGALMLSVCAVGGTTAYITVRTDPIENRFQAAEVSCEVEEELYRDMTTAIAVKNTGTTPVYVRVKLVSYRVNEEGRQIGGWAEIPAFGLGDGWREGGNDTYYYQYPIPGPQSGYVNRTENMIAQGSGIRLKEYSEEEGGGRQVVEMIGEAIQSSPQEAVRDAWPEEIVEWLSPVQTESRGLGWEEK